MEELLEGVAFAGIAVAPMVSILISILKGWLDLDKIKIATLNIVLSGIIIAIYAVVEQDVGVLQAITMSMTSVFSSKLFHDTFGHLGKGVLGNFTQQ